MEKEIQFYRLLIEQRRVSSVTRWNGTPQIHRDYNVATHAFNCANILLMLSVIQDVEPDGKLLALLLTHDNIEAFTGDLLAPAKDLLPEKWDEIENEVQQNTVRMLDAEKEEEVEFRWSIYNLFPTDEDIKRKLRTAPFLLLKLIDMYEFLNRVAEEYQSGNRHKNIIRALKYGTDSFNKRCLQMIEELGDVQQENFYKRSTEILASSLKYFYRDAGCYNLCYNDD